MQGANHRSKQSLLQQVGGQVPQDNKHINNFVCLCSTKEIQKVREKRNGGVCVHIHISLSIYLFVYLSIYLSLCVCLSVCRSMYLSICLSIYQNLREDAIDAIIISNLPGFARTGKCMFFFQMHCIFEKPWHGMHVQKGEQSIDTHTHTTRPIVETRVALPAPKTC